MRNILSVVGLIFDKDCWWFIELNGLIRVHYSNFSQSGQSFWASQRCLTNLILKDVILGVCRLSYGILFHTSILLKKKDVISEIVFIVNLIWVLFFSSIITEISRVYLTMPPFTNSNLLGRFVVTRSYPIL